MQSQDPQIRGEFDHALREADHALQLSRQLRKLTYVFNYKENFTLPKPKASIKKQKSKSKTSSKQQKSSKPSAISSLDPNRRKSLRNAVIEITSATTVPSQSTSQQVDNLPANADRSGLTDPKSSATNNTEDEGDDSGIEDLCLNEGRNIDKSASTSQTEGAYYSSQEESDSDMEGKRIRKKKVYEGFHSGADFDLAFRGKRKSESGKSTSDGQEKGSMKTNEAIKVESALTQHQVDMLSATDQLLNRVKKDGVKVDDKEQKENVPAPSSTSRKSKRFRFPKEPGSESPKKKKLSKDDKTAKAEKGSKVMTPLETVSQPATSSPGTRATRTKIVEKKDSDTPSSTEKRSSSRVTEQGSPKKEKMEQPKTSAKNAPKPGSEKKKPKGDTKKKLQLTVLPFSGVRDLDSPSETDSVNGENGKQKYQFCAICERSTENLITCKGQCCSSFHMDCLGIKKLPASGFKCDECLTGCHTCFICKEAGDLRRCAVNNCGKYYHPECLKEFTKHYHLDSKSDKDSSDKGLRNCPLHYCRYCSTENEDVCEGIGKLMKCIRCPTAYHSVTCVVAGSVKVSPNHIICDNHFEPSEKNKLINVVWCFVCSQGGTLVCCDTCPAAFHAECRDDLDGIPEGAWQCDNCKRGEKPRYGDVVWVKFGVFRYVYHESVRQILVLSSKLINQPIGYHIFANIAFRKACAA